jgi:hypothetical protein
MTSSITGTRRVSFLAPCPHLMTEGSGPAVIGVSSNNFAVDLVDLDLFAHPIDVNGPIFAEHHILSVYLLHVDQQLFHGFDEYLVSRAGRQLQRLDHGGVHGAD